MVIGIDIDDTITETTLNVMKYLAKYDPKCLDYHNLSKDRYKEFMIKYVDDIMETNELKDGVKEAFEYLNNNGYKICIITARNNDYTGNTEDITKKYLETNGLKYDKILFERHEKGFDAKRLGVQIFVDDKEFVLDDISKYDIECIRITSDISSKYRNYSKWKDIINYLKSREG